MGAKESERDKERIVRRLLHKKRAPVFGDIDASVAGKPAMESHGCEALDVGDHIGVLIEGLFSLRETYLAYFQKVRSYHTARHFTCFL